MVEGFALWGDASPFARDDWELQMNRALGLIAQDKIVIGQTYVTDVRERLFALGSYLLIKGNRTFLNLELDLDPEWWPEYGIPIGAPLAGAGTDIDNLATGTLYRRNFTTALCWSIRPTPAPPSPSRSAAPSTWPSPRWRRRAHQRHSHRHPDLRPRHPDHPPPYSAAILLNAAP